MLKSCTLLRPLSSSGHHPVVACGSSLRPRVLRLWCASQPHFRIAYVFDVAQTEGRDLAALLVRKLEGFDSEGVQSQLATVAASIGFSVEWVELGGTRNGDCDNLKHCIRIEASNESRQQVKTLVHEIAHAILHGGDDGTNRQLAELEAESVAYVVCADLGIDSSEYSFGYLASRAGGGEEARYGISASAQRIHPAASRILDSLGAHSAL